MPFWFVLLTEHKVLHFYATNAVYRCLVAGQNSARLVASVQQTVDATKFPTLVGQFTQGLFVHHTALTDRDFKSESHLPEKYS